MNIQRLIDSINRYESINGFKPHGITMLASDMADVQAEQVNGAVGVAYKRDDTTRDPKGKDGETYVMTFLGVPVFICAEGLEPDHLSMWVDAEREPQAVPSLKSQLRKRR